MPAKVTRKATQSAVSPPSNPSFPIEGISQNVQNMVVRIAAGDNLSVPDLIERLSPLIEKNRARFTTFSEEQLLVRSLKQYQLGKQSGSQFQTETINVVLIGITTPYDYLAKQIEAFRAFEEASPVICARKGYNGITRDPITRQLKKGKQVLKEHNYITNYIFYSLDAREKFSTTIFGDSVDSYAHPEKVTTLIDWFYHTSLILKIEKLSAENAADPTKLTRRRIASIEISPNQRNLDELYNDPAMLIFDVISDAESLVAFFDEHKVLNPQTGAEEVPLAESPLVEGDVYNIFNQSLKISFDFADNENNCTVWLSSLLQVIPEKMATVRMLVSMRAPPQKQLQLSAISYMTIIEGDPEEEETEPSALEENVLTDTSLVSATFESVDGGLTLEEIVASSKIPKSRVLGAIAILVDAGVLLFDSDTQIYFEPPPVQEESSETNTPEETTPPIPEVEIAIPETTAESDLEEEGDN